MTTERLITIGKRVRRLRQAANMTQSELAERADLTHGFISQFERGKVSISIDSLMMLLDALNISISDFFRPTAERIVFGESETVALEREGVSEFLALVPGGGNRQMEPVKVKLAPSESTSMDPFNGEQFGYVLQGRLALAHADKSFRASKGETFYTDGSHQLVIENRSKREAVFLWVTSPPYF